MTNPVRWVEGETPTKAKLDTYITALQEVEAVTPLTPVRFAVPFIQGGAVGNLIRYRRYLHFKDDGELEDPSAIEEPITLTADAETQRGTLDLTTTWVEHEMMFRITGSDAAWLDDEP
jgi:hypothetical protein